MKQFLILPLFLLLSLFSCKKSEIKQLKKEGLYSDIPKLTILKKNSTELTYYPTFHYTRMAHGKTVRYDPVNDLMYGSWRDFYGNIVPSPRKKGGRWHLCEENKAVALVFINASNNFHLDKIGQIYTSCNDEIIYVKNESTIVVVKDFIFLWIITDFRDGDDKLKPLGRYAIFFHKGDLYEIKMN